jgi:hypothetical protein
MTVVIIAWRDLSHSVPDIGRPYVQYDLPISGTEIGCQVAHVLGVTE